MNQDSRHPAQSQPQPKAQAQAQTPTPPRPDPADMVCVTLQRPPHFWRFACTPDQTADLLERLAEIADDPNIELTWSDAELIASEIVVHHHLGPPSAGPINDR